MLAGDGGISAVASRIYASASRIFVTVAQIFVVVSRISAVVSLMIAQKSQFPAQISQFSAIAPDMLADDGGISATVARISVAENRVFYFCLSNFYF
jgi:hypothetical protein